MFERGTSGSVDDPLRRHRSTDPAWSDTMVETHGLTHISLAVRDPQRSLEFYTQLFGVREYYRDEGQIQVQGPGPFDVLAFERDPAVAGATVGFARDAAPDEITGPGDYSLSIVHGGLTRLYRVHVPSAYSTSRPIPLVFSFHGGGGNMDYQANDSYYGQISKSEQASYVAVFPNG